jgi:branched-subunit amino acid aminotransferase/4-amino-4-deoxychorismate lyase
VTDAAPFDSGAAARRLRSGRAEDEPLCWIGGRVLPERDAAIPVRDLGFQSGCALFETIRVVRGRPFRIGAHIERMRLGATGLKVAAPRAGDIEAAARELLAAYGARDAVLKLFLTAGDPPDLAPAFFATARPPRALPPDARTRGVVLEVAGDVVAGASPLSPFKTVSRAERWLAREGARAQGAYDALLLDAHGHVVEGAGTNVFLVRGAGRLATPDLGRGAIRGTARGLVMEIARERGLEVVEERVRFDDVADADEVFVTSALAGVLPVRQVGDLPVRAAPGAVTRALAARLDALVAAECGG